MIHTMQQARNANQRAGYHFFDASTMRFFGSRLPRKVYPVPNGALFVTSEQRPAGYGEDLAPRRYTVRFIHDIGLTHTIGEFQAFTTREGANRYARLLVAEWTASTYFGEYRNPRNGRTVPVAVIDEPAAGLVRCIRLGIGYSTFTGERANLDRVTRFIADDNDGEVK